LIFYSKKIMRPARNFLLGARG